MFINKMDSEIEKIVLDLTLTTENQKKLKDLLKVLSPEWYITFISDVPCIHHKNYGFFIFRGLFECTPENSNMFYLIKRVEKKEIPKWFWDKYATDEPEYQKFK